MLSRISDQFILADKICDCIPGLSIVNNLTDLFIKTVAFPIIEQLHFIKEESLLNNHYYQHLNNKDICFALFAMIPIIGNIVAGLSNVLCPSCCCYSLDDDAFCYRDTWLGNDRIRNNKKFVLTAITKHDGRELMMASPQMQNDPDVVLAAVEQKGLALKYASKELQDDPKIVLAAVEQNGLALKYASKELQDDPKIVLAAVKQHRKASRFASENDALLAWAGNGPRNDEEVVFEAVKKNPRNLRFANKKFLGNRKIMLEVFSNKSIRGIGRILQFTTKDIKEDKEVVLKAVNSYGPAILLASKELQHDPDVVLAASKCSWLRDTFDLGKYPDQFLYSPSFCGVLLGKFKINPNPCAFFYPEDFPFTSTDEVAKRMDFTGLTQRLSYDPITYEMIKPHLPKFKISEGLPILCPNAL